MERQQEILDINDMTLLMHASGSGCPKVFSAIAQEVRRSQVITEAFYHIQWCGRGTPIYVFGNTAHEESLIPEPNIHATLDVHSLFSRRSANEELCTPLKN